MRPTLRAVPPALRPAHHSSGTLTCLDSNLKQDDALLPVCRTEMYNCRACGSTTRFPRYNDPGKLLETRCG